MWSWSSSSSAAFLKLSLSLCLSFLPLFSPQNTSLFWFKKCRKISHACRKREEKQKKRRSACAEKKKGEIDPKNQSSRENLLELHARDIIVLITARINTKKKNGFYRPVHPSHERESVGCQDRKLEATTFREIGFANFERDLRVQRRNGRPKTRDVFVRGTPRDVFFLFFCLQFGCKTPSSLLRNAMMMLRLFVSKEHKPDLDANARSIRRARIRARRQNPRSNTHFDFEKRGG